MTSIPKTSLTLRTDFAVSGHRLVDGQRIYSAQVLTPFSDAQTNLRQGYVGISANDTHVKHLEDAVVGTTDVISVTVNNDGANETITIGMDASNAAVNQVPTADGTGGVSWEDQQGSGMGGGGVTLAQVRGLVEDWAETGNATSIPEIKLHPNTIAKIDNAFIDASVSGNMLTFTRNSGTNPDTETLVAVPSGGTTAQFLVKLSDTDGDVGWMTLDLSRFLRLPVAP